MGYNRVEQSDALKIKKYVETNISDKSVNLAKLAKVFGLSKHAVTVNLKDNFGGLKKIQDDHRKKISLDMIERGMTSKEISDALGFESRNPSWTRNLLKRWHNYDAASGKVYKADYEFLDKVREFIDDNFQSVKGPYGTIGFVSKSLGITESELEGRLDAVGYEYKELYREIFLEHAKYYLDIKELSMTLVRRKMGQKSKQFSENFHRATGKTPEEYRASL